MANRRMQSLVGAAAGGATPLYLARDQEPSLQPVETVGGLIGDAVGGRLPDLFEPSLAPRHRSVAQALVPTGVVGLTFGPSLHGVQQPIREWADRCRAQCDAATSTLEQILWWLAEMACRLAAGSMAGIAAGYASHLLLGAGTPMGLPLLA